MISLSSTVWGSAQVISTPAPSGADPDSDPKERRRPAMVIRRRPTPDVTVEVGPADPLHPSGRVDIYL